MSEEKPFKSRPPRLTLLTFARDSFTGGNSLVKLGALRPGFCVMAPGRDVAIRRVANPMEDPGFDRLVPRKVRPAEVRSGNNDDPLHKLTYAVFRFGTRSMKLDRTFNDNAWPRGVAGEAGGSAHEP